MRREAQRKNRRRSGRPPALTDLQKKQIREIAQEEIAAAFRRMFGGIGIRRGSRKS